MLIVCSPSDQLRRWSGPSGPPQRSQDKRVGILGQLGADAGALKSSFLGAAANAMRSLTGTVGFTPHSWQDLSTGARPGIREPGEFEAGAFRQGWQHEAASRVEQQFRDQVLFERLPGYVRSFVWRAWSKAAPSRSAHCFLGFHQLALR